MSRKKRELTKSLKIKAGTKVTNVSPILNEPSLNWWSTLGKFERFSIVGLSLFLVASAFGMTGLGGKILNTLTGDSASQNQSARNNSQPPTLNPTVNGAATGTPQLSKEYIYAGSRILAVEDANANAAPPVDLAVWRPSNGSWYVMGTGGSILAAQQFGANGDKPVPGDYDGDSKTDFAVFRSNQNETTWYILKSSDNNYYGASFGAYSQGDYPVPADYDGDGKTDIAVYRATEGKWYIAKSSDQSLMIMQFGVNLNIDQTAPADYDGDGKADIAVWRKGDQAFYALYSSSNYAPYQTAVLSTASTTNSVPVSADYDGDGKADFAAKSGTGWSIKRSSDGQIETLSFSWQQAGDKEVSNDYDGDGKVDIAVWRGATGDWYIRQSSLIGQSNELRQSHWGQTGDIPVPVFYRR